MATLVLSAVGNYLGGPIGSAIGAIIGQQIDQSIFGPPGRQGPRLSDLSVQTSSYGTKIPKLFGAVRAAGTVIWATDLRESSSTSGGKGQPSVTAYTYSCSFAVMLSARSIKSVGRIWADGNLLRGAAGDWKTQTGFTLYTGQEDQAIDPLIASAEGINQTPAYRGAAYAVFQDLQLAHYGNRIPSLTFEVFADDGAVSFHSIIRDLSLGGTLAICPSAFGGYAASSDTIGAAIETLAGVAPIRVWDDGAILNIEEAAQSTIILDGAALGSRADLSRTQRIAITRQSASTIAQTLALNYYDAARDYQKSAQSARRSGGARKQDDLNLPVTLSASEARAFAESRLSTIWAERVTAKISLPWRYLALQPGMNLAIPGSAETWRIAAINFNKMVLEVDLVRTTAAASVNYAASAGKAVIQTDLPAGPTTLFAFDLPLLTDGVASAPIVVAAAAGVSPGWRDAALSTSFDDGGSWTPAGSTAPPAILGVARSVLASSSPDLIDTQNSVDVQLLNADMQLQDATDDALFAGANVAWVGGELIQFGHALPRGGGAWRLSRLLRGRRGTEELVGDHVNGEPFIMLDRNTLISLDTPIGTARLKVMAQGVGDIVTAVYSNVPQPGVAVRPLSPAHLAVQPQSNGDFQISWVRRSRDGWRWVDGVDAPLAEQSEIYQITATLSSGQTRVVRSALPEFIYTASQIASDLALGAGSSTFSIVQIGTAATSLPSTILVPLN